MAQALEIVCHVCKNSFSNKGNLKKHYETVHPGVPISQEFENLKDRKESCPKCGKSVSKSNLARHIKVCNQNMQHTNSATNVRVRDVEEINDSGVFDESVFARNNCVKEMLRECMAKRDGLSRQHMKNYLHAIDQFDKFTGADSKLTPRTFLAKYKNNFEDYFNTLQTVFERYETLHALQYAFDMLDGAKLISSCPKIKQLGSSDVIIQRYLNSSERVHYYNQLTSNPVSFKNEIGVLHVRNFLIVEILLAQGSTDLVNKLNRGHYLNGTAVFDQFNTKKWSYTIGKDVFEISCELRTMLHNYFAIMRREVLIKTKVIQNNIVKAWDPSTDHEIKFFAVSENGRHFQVELKSSTFDTFHMISKSHKCFKTSDFLNSAHIFKTPRIGATSGQMTNPSKSTENVKPDPKRQKTDSQRSASQIRKGPLPSQIVEEQLSPKSATPLKDSLSTKSVNVRKKKYSTYQFKSDERDFILETFKRDRDQSLSKTVIFARRLENDKFDEFFSRILSKEEYSSDSLAEQVLRILKNR